MGKIAAGKAKRRKRQISLILLCSFLPAVKNDEGCSKRQAGCYVRTRVCLSVRPAGNRIFLIGRDVEKETTLLLSCLENLIQSICSYGYSAIGLQPHKALQSKFFAPTLAAE